MTKPLHQEINKRILRLEFTQISPPAFIPGWDTQMRFDPGVFYESVYQYVCLHIEKYGTVILIPRQKALKTLSVYRLLLTHETLKQIHQKSLYVDIDDPGDEVLEVLKGRVEAAEQRLPENLSRKTVDRIWNSIKMAYGGKQSPPDAEIFDEFENTDIGDADFH